MAWIKRLLLLLLSAALVVLIVSRVSNQKEAMPLETPEPTPLVFETPPVELTAVLTASQLEALDASALKRLDLTGSTCYHEIETFVASHPWIDVTYSVAVYCDEEPMRLPPDIQELTIENASCLSSLAENASHLPLLRQIDIQPDIADGQAVDALREAFPEAKVQYSLLLLGEAYPYDIEELTLTGLDAQALDQLLPLLSRFPHLTTVNLPQEENDLELSDAIKLSQADPAIKLNYQLELYGQTISLSDEELVFENTEIGNEGLDELRALLPYMTGLRRIVLDSCGIDYEVLEQFRDELTDIELVWRVYFGNYHTLTDTEMIWATGSSVNDDNAWVLKYCTRVKYLDLGHTLISKIDFVSYMPDLEVVILANTWVNSLKPISDCHNLEYIEAFSTCVTDYSPLAACTHLQHVNISHPVDRRYNRITGYIDISSLYDLPELKRFYCTMCDVKQSQKDEMKARHPDCEFDFSWEDPAEGLWRFEKDGKTYNERYALLREQFGYDTLQQSGKTWSLYG